MLVKNIPTKPKITYIQSASMPYPRSNKTCTFNTMPCCFWFWCKNMFAATKVVRYIFLNENLFHETRIEIDLSLKDFGSKQLYISLVNGIYNGNTYIWCKTW